MPSSCTAAVRRADARPGYDNARYYPIQITATQFLDKPRDASASVARSCNCDFAALSRYVSEMVQDTIYRMVSFPIIVYVHINFYQSRSSIVEVMKM